MHVIEEASNFGISDVGSVEEADEVKKAELMLLVCCCSILRSAELSYPRHELHINLSE